MRFRTFDADRSEAELAEVRREEERAEAQREEEGRAAAAAECAEAERLAG